MFPLPTIQLSQQFARIGIEATKGQLEIKQPKADFEISTIPSQMDMEQALGELLIDQSKAWDALAMGSIYSLNERITAQARDIALQAIQQIVEKGNRLAAIHLGGEPIADMAQERAFSSLDIEYTGQASIDNVDIHYTPKKPVIQYKPAEVNVAFHPNPPEIQYTSGNVNIYLRQRNALEIIPPQIDLKL